jgi:HAD superfamily hydrolase (TIGR01509 family)
MPLEAVVFDFDGLIIDSERAIFETARAAFAAHGHALPIEVWATIVGTSDGDAREWERLCEAAGAAGFARADFDAAYEAQDRSNRDGLPALPGVAELAAALAGAGVPLAIASSSSLGWLERHVARLGLGERFAALVGADLVGGVGKPAPDVYLRACAELGADPAFAVALEDSRHGVAAAKAAGMAVVAVPGHVTASHDLSAADLVVGSLEDVTVADLAALVADGRQ